MSVSESVRKLQSWVQLWAITEAALPKHIQALLPNSELPSGVSCLCKGTSLSNTRGLTGLVFLPSLTQIRNLSIPPSLPKFIQAFPFPFAPRELYPQHQLIKSKRICAHALEIPE